MFSCSSINICMGLILLVLLASSDFVASISAAQEARKLEQAQLKKHATLFFLFVEEGSSFNNAKIWSSYFHSRHQAHTKHHVIIHPLHNPAEFSIPTTEGENHMVFKMSQFSSSAEHSKHHKDGIEHRRLAAMQQLLVEGLAASTNDLDMFLFISSDTIPLKPLSEIYTDLFNNGHGFVRSSFCIAPSDLWGENAVDPTMKAVRINPRFILNKDDSLIIAEKIKLAYQFPDVSNYSHIKFDDSMDHKALAQQSTRAASPRLSEFWFFGALFGELDSNRLVTVGDKQWAVVSAHSTSALHDWLYVDPAAECTQGSCHTYHFGHLQSVTLTAEKTVGTSKILPPTTAATTGAVQLLFNTSLETLTELRNTKFLFFAQSVRDAENIASVYIAQEDTSSFDGNQIHMPSTTTTSIGAAATSTISLYDALVQLNIYTDGVEGGDNSTTTTTSSVENHTKKGHHHSFVAGSHMRFRHGRRDNTGLRVLVVSVDDRDVSDELKSNDYVSMVAILQQDYCIRHGYDYVSFRTDNELLHKAVVERYPNVSMKNANFEETKYGYASYHPGLSQFRASSWGKLPPLWYLATEYGDHYDYIWFMDSDAAPNPLHNNRSLGDALADWKRDSDTMIYRGNKDPYEATFIFMSNFPWRSDLPCAGTFIFKPSALGETILREWWDYDLWMKNRADFMEQDACKYIFHLIRHGLLLVLETMLRYTVKMM